MDDDEFERICALSAYPDPDVATGESPLSVTEEVFTVIRRQVEHRRLRAALRQHRQDRTLHKYLSRHGTPGRADSGESMCAIARSVDFSPCMLARVILEAQYGWSKTTISNLFKDVMGGTRRWPLRLPGALPGPTRADKATTTSSSAATGTDSRELLTEAEYDALWREVDECIHNDPLCSPLADRIRHNMGLEYEYILLVKLRGRGIPFESEDALREKGLSKTPDVRLLLPIGVRDDAGELHVVNWIDSKAMFGDRHTHETENAGQLQGYVNRYGPGMVIYWFGYMANLTTDQDVYITSAFPDRIELPGDWDPHEGTEALVAGQTLPLDVVPCPTAFDDDADLTPRSTCRV